MKLTRRQLCLAAGALAAGLRSDGATAAETSTIKLLDPSRLPAYARRYADVLGDAVKRPGKERRTVKATLSNDKGAVGVEWVWQFPGHLRLDTPNGKGSIIFNPSRSRMDRLDELNEAIVESLCADTAEYVLALMQDGQSPRFLGTGFRNDVVSSGHGAFLDILEVEYVVQARNTPSASVKQYMFDSTSGLLYQVTYTRDGNGAYCCTRYPGYQSINGVTVPSTVIRSQGGKPYFSLNISSAQPGAAVADDLL